MIPGPKIQNFLDFGPAGLIIHNEGAMLLLATGGTDPVAVEILMNF